MIRHALIGMMVACAANTAAAQQQEPATQQVGRYQIVLSPVTARDTFLLDTVTGKVWQLTKFIGLKGEPIAWDVMDRIDDGGELFAFEKAWGKKPAVPAPKR